MRAALIWFLLSVPLFGQLAWESRTLEFKPMAGERSQSAKFKFQNAGQKPVTILNIQTSCGCTTAETAKKTYLPGEQGEVAVNFLFGGRRGPQNKSIVVSTDDSREASVILIMKVDILELVKVRPSFLYWKKNAEKTPQTIDLKMTSSVPAKVVSVSSSDSHFTAELKPDEDGKEYELIVTPLDTSSPVLATLTIQTDYPAGRPESYKAYVQIK